MLESQVMRRRQWHSKPRVRGTWVELPWAEWYLSNDFLRS